MSFSTALIEADRSAFLAINGAHSPWADTFFWTVSDPLTWIPVYALCLFMVKVRWGLRGLGLSVLVIGLMILLTDTGSVLLFKNTVQRLRPSHAEDLKGLVHLVRNDDGGHYMGGLFGFVSSHASNHFGIALFMIGILQRKPAWTVVALLAWAALIAYSRVYLGVHYPGDVIVGGLYGALCGALCFRLFLFLHQRWAQK